MAGLVLDALGFDRSSSGLGHSTTPSSTALALEVTPTSTPSVSRSTFGTVPTFSQNQNNPFSNAFQSKSTNIFGSSETPAESRFGASNIFSFGFGSTQPNKFSSGFWSTHPNNSTLGFGSKEPDKSSLGFQSTEANKLSLGFGNKDPKNSPLSFWSTQTDNSSFSFGSTQHNSLFDQTMPCDLKLTPVTSNSVSAATFNKELGTAIKFKPVTCKESLLRNGLTETINVTFQCITCMECYRMKSFEELRYEDYLVPFRIPKLHKGIGQPFCNKTRRFTRAIKINKKADSKPKSSVVDEKVDHSPFGLTKFSVFDDCEPAPMFQKELLKSTKTSSFCDSEAMNSQELDKLSLLVKSLSVRLDKLEHFSYQKGCHTKEETTDLLPWILYNPKLNLSENKVPEDLEVQRLAGVLNCLILTVSEQDRKEIEFLMVLVSTWPSLPDYVKTFIYNKMEILWQALISTIRSEENQKANCCFIVNERQPYCASPSYFSVKKESP